MMRISSKRTFFALCVAVAIFTGPGLLCFADTCLQETCPIMGYPVNKDIYTDYNGQRVYFCCAACVDMFNKDPDAYLEKLKKQGVEPEMVPQEG